MWYLVALCLFGWGAWGICETQAVKAGGPIATLCWSLIAYACVAIFAVPTITSRAVSVPNILWSFAASLCAVIAMTSYIFLVQHIPVYLATSLTAAYPIITALLALMFFGEKVSLRDFAGVGLTVCGIIVLTWKS